MSMVWFLGKKVASHNGSTWFAELQPWTSLSYVTSDAGAGLKAGIARMQKLRGETNQVPLEKGLDVFHTKREGQRALRVIWMRVERAWERADAADRALKRARWQGRSERKLTQQVHEAWTKAFGAFKLYEKREAVWKRAETALDVFRPDGQLNDRAWAQEQVTWALSRLPGSEWSKVRGLLQSKESFTFLDRLHDQLGRLSLPETSRDALVRLWWLRRQLPRKSAETAVARLSPCGYRGAASSLRQVGPELARVVPSARDRVASDGASQQRSGVHEQRPANASVAASDADARDVGPETSVLEYSSVSRGEAERPLSV